MKQTSGHKVICFGEILWDNLPGGIVPGGAPMNVAYHLKKLGVDPFLITRIGNDEWGRRLKELTDQKKIRNDFFQVDPDLPTGIVNAEIGDNHEVTYDIVKPVAWDNIEWRPEFDALNKQAELFVFGSLAARSEVSRTTLLRLLETAKLKIFDVNLRAPHYGKDLIGLLLKELYLLKLNEAELKLISGWFVPNAQSDEARMRMLQDKFSIPHVVVTKGSAGALFLSGSEIYTHPVYRVEVADTVGSGDAFLAALVQQVLNAAEPAFALKYACALGALIASYNGACPDYELSEIDMLLQQNN